MNDLAPTRITLLQRAKDSSDQAVWAELSDYYRGFISMLLKDMRVPMMYHDDLIQEIMLKLWTSINKFNIHEGRARFRTWLSKVIRNCVIDYMKSEKSRKKREEASGEEDNQFNLFQQKASDLEEIIHQEWMDYMLHKAITHLKKSFSGHAIDIFMMSSQGKTVDEICEALNVPANTVYVLRSRVKSKFMAELKQLRELFEF